MHRKHCPGKVFWCGVVIVAVFVRLCGLVFLFISFLRWGGRVVVDVFWGEGSCFLLQLEYVCLLLIKLKVTESVCLTCLLLALAQTLHVSLAFSTEAETPLVRYNYLHMNY